MRRDRDGVLDQDGLVGGDVVDRGTTLLRLDRLVLVGDEDVTDAAHERRGRL